MIKRLGVDLGADTIGSGEWDLCIVGAGAAGLALAVQFVGVSQRVLVLESGLHAPDTFAEDLNAVVPVGLPHDGATLGRVRAFGGTTRAWGGQLVPMRASELAARPWVPDSGWPLDCETLQPYYRRVEQLLRVEGPPYDREVWQRLGLADPGFDPGEIQVRFSQWAALGRRNFAVLWRRQLENASNVTVVLDATAVNVRCSGQGRHCEGVDIRSRDGIAAEVRARSTVIACGGIESARLLLASAGGAAVANSSGRLGRYFQDHISYRAGELEPVSRRVVQDLFDPRYVGNTMFSVKLEPTDESMRRNGWLNAMAHLAFEIPEALGWMELRRILRSAQAGRIELPSLHEALEMLRGSRELARLMFARVWARRRRSPDNGRIQILVDTEQAPQAGSRITLDTSVDAVGMPRARFDWRISELERQTLTGFARTVGSEFERLGLGKVRLAAEPDLHARDSPGAARDIYHHMGTTRMSRSPQRGVTRPDLRCHDVDNLYIVGPSVFPAGGIANPTFTALALALRLADELKSGSA